MSTNTHTAAVSFHMPHKHHQGKFKMLLDKNQIGLNLISNKVALGVKSIHFVSNNVARNKIRPMP